LIAREFGDDFSWGVAMAAIQNEGAYNSYGNIMIGLFFILRPMEWG